MKVYLETLGCKLNESELESWARKFAAEGNEIVASPSDADICVLNTCTVTAQAARKSRNIARQLASANPNAKLVLTGCFASTDPNQARSLPNVALVVPNAEKDGLVQKANGLLPIAECTVSAIQSSVNSQQSPEFLDSLLVAQHSALRTRAFVKIQDGCNMSCTYCIIPLARGKERSRPVNEIVAEVQSLVDAGYKEIILTGVQISEYRTHPVLGDGRRSEVGLHHLVSAILSETNVPRLRLTSIAPWDLDEALLDLFNDARLCRHLHLSLQSGNDTVLKRMRRPYTTEQFARAVEMAHAKIQDVAITTDVIVGFPGESDHEFEQSLEFVERMRFARVHSFSYSPRAGTIAAGLPLQVSDQVKQARAEKMQRVADHAVRVYLSRFIGREMEVLWENREKTADRRQMTNGTLRWFGHTDNYIRVMTESDRDLHNHLTLAVLNRVEGDALMAAIV